MPIDWSLLAGVSFLCRSRVFAASALIYGCVSKAANNSAPRAT